MQSDDVNIRLLPVQLSDYVRLSPVQLLIDISIDPGDEQWKLSSQCDSPRDVFGSSNFIQSISLEERR